MDNPSVHQPMMISSSLAMRDGVDKMSVDSNEEKRGHNTQLKQLHEKCPQRSSMSSVG
jgi:hypothetical protein